MKKAKKVFSKKVRLAREWDMLTSLKLNKKQRDKLVAYWKEYEPEKLGIFVHLAVPDVFKK